MTPPPQSPPQPRSTSTTPEASPRPPISLLQPSQKNRASKHAKVYRVFRSIFRAFPIITPSCKFPTLPTSALHDNHIHGGTRMTGTLFGYRKARITLSIQENPRCLPIFLLELAIQTTKLLQEMGSGLVRIALECEKHTGGKTKLIDEPIWTMYCNGRKTGYAAKREPNDEDLNVMQLLHAVSMGAGVLPGETTELPDGELTYMRANFERVVGSKDSETFYMMNPDGNSGPELSIFFVRL
ncbi:MIZU-KUSSEI-like protein (Protein of unknown function, DUF617) [Tasmannia lanceolata]|uniref:MIZU-KUSSEI-like protein (Protein of unknown function, DUF617) n=1 Tax=Tasmannia lanceolata TaxID=3420 RepID=UPI00406494EC